MNAADKLPRAQPPWRAVYHDLPERGVVVLCHPKNGGEDLLLRRHPDRSVWTRPDSDVALPIAIFAWQPHEGGDDTTMQMSLF